MGRVSEMLNDKKWVSSIVADKTKVRCLQLCFKASDKQRSSRFILL